MRAEPSTGGEIVTTVTPGETYTYSEEQSGWYKIIVDDETEGWVSGEYVEVQE